ncbi:MAG: DNA repair exonuclease, partial [Deltaproteobacteria bacterium]|nr:DNA repair exonuclease [Deltaproteobacteria bacterium]
MIKFIHAADIHLDSPLHKLEAYEGTPVEEMRHATRRAFENLINLAIEEEVDFVLIAGDLYDSDWKDYNTGLYLVSQLTKLREAEIPVFIIAGNHDALSKITKTLRLPEGVTMFPSNKATTAVIEDLGIAIHGRSFSSAVMKKNLAQNYPSKMRGYFNIGLLHTSLNGREGHETYAPCSLDDLLNKGYDYWALGHAHKQEIVHKQEPVIAFSGNTQGRHIRETGPKGTLIVNIDDAGKVRLDFRSLDVVRWEKLEVDASKADDGYMVVDMVTEQLETLAEKNDDLPLIVRVKIHGNSPAHEELAGDVERWINEIRSAAIDSTHGSACIEKVM